MPRRFVLFVLFVLLAASVAAQENPDGPVGAVALEPAFTLGGFSNVDRTLQSQDRSVGLRWSDGVQLGDIEGDWQRYSLSVLVPASAKITFGASFTWERQDVTDTEPFFEHIERKNVKASVYEIGFRMRYWWNLPKY